jgi:hypothetical protein
MMLCVVSLIIKHEIRNSKMSKTIYEVQCKFKYFSLYKGREYYTLSCETYDEWKSYFLVTKLQCYPMPRGKKVYNKHTYIQNTKETNIRE